MIFNHIKELKAQGKKVGITETDSGGHLFEDGHCAWAKVIMEHLS